MTGPVRCRCCWVTRPAAPIIAVDLHDDALALAAELGADIVLRSGRSGSDTAEEIIRATGGGVDLAVDASGAVAAIETAYRSLLRGGQLVLVGLPNPAARWPVSPAELVANDITVRGSYLGSSVPTRDVARFFALHRRGRLDVGRLVGRTIGLDEVAQGWPTCTPVPPAESSSRWPDSSRNALATDAVGESAPPGALGYPPSGP